MATKTKEIRFIRNPHFRKFLIKHSIFNKFIDNLYASFIEKDPSFF